VTIEAIVRIPIHEGATVSTAELTRTDCIVTPASDRDPLVASFLVAFAAGGTLEFVKGVKSIARRHGGFSLTLRSQRRRLTLDTTDSDLDTEALLKLLSSFLEQREGDTSNRLPGSDE
jgi:hypothetical protein